MGYTLLYQDNVTFATYDISTLANDIQHYTELDSQAGKLTFTLQKDPNKLLTKVRQGATIVLMGSLKVLFRGKIFASKMNKDGIMQITAYDALRYLQNKDTMSCVDKTLFKFAQDIANASNIRINVGSCSSERLENQLFQSQTYFQMLRTVFDQIFNKTGTYLFLRDNNGTIEITDPTKCMTSNYIGSGSNLTDFEYSEDIDTDTFTKIMLFIKDKKTGSLKMVEPQQNLLNATLWGVLQEEKTFDENVKDEQAIQYGIQFLANKGRVRKTISIKALNIDGLNAGNGFYFVIPELNIAQSVYITRATHYYNNDLSTMDLEVSLIV
jgi:hypothetical protein